MRGRGHPRTHRRPLSRQQNPRRREDPSQDGLRTGQDRLLQGSEDPVPAARPQHRARARGVHQGRAPLHDRGVHGERRPQPVLGEARARKHSHLALQAQSGESPQVGRDRFGWLASGVLLLYLRFSL